MQPVQIYFKNLQRSDFTETAVLDRILAVITKFPGLEEGRIRITLEMLNGPEQPGPDRFAIRMQVLSGRYRGVRLEKSAENLHIALAELVDHALERLNRFGDRNRVKDRRKARAMLQTPWKFSFP